MEHGGLPDTADDPSATLLRGLTPEQRDAVLCTEGPLLVLAAAGSGKTRVITRRIAHLVSCGVPAWNILALTFTNKAAAEMRERVLTLLGGAEDRRARGLTVTTFHALCARLLRRFAPEAGLSAEFSIMNSDDQASLCKKAIEACQLATSNFPPRSVLSAISRAKNDLLDAEAYAARAREWNTKNIARIFAEYTRLMRQANAVDFDDLLVLTAKLLRDNASVRGECQSRWRYLLVDEYQDTNHAQFVIASMIAGDGRPRAGSSPDGAACAAAPNICVVGDPDQSIYGWRGADLGNILEFEEHYAGCRVITLGENFRSTAPILALADALIRHNQRRKHKPLFTRRPGGENPEAVLCRDEGHEASLVADWLARRHEAGAAWREMAVFYRTNSLSRVMEDALRTRGVPYTIARGTAFFEREEVRTALAYLRVVANGADDVSLARIINTPTRGIGKTTFDALEAFAGAARVPALQALRRAGEVPGLGARAVPAIGRFLEMLDAWTGGGTFMGQTVAVSLTDLVDRVIRESGLRDMYAKQAQTSGSDADAQRVDNLDELVSSARQFEMEYDPTSDAALAPGIQSAPPLLALLRAYLESVALVADADAVDPAQGSVTLMTLHAAKGLEFDSVAMIGLEEGMLPHSRAFESDADLEEERRLCFVGITRAMRRLLLTSAKYRTHRGVPDRTVPSRFLGELPREFLAIADQSDAFEGLDPAWRGDEDEGEGHPSRRVGPTGTIPPRPPGPRPTPSVPFQVGERVRHPQFGVGEVVSITPGAQARATVKFRDLGVKTLILEYARLVPVR
ncbi:MAG: UvrD-helicase domain-containing protein [Planctomycetota bacterium]|nr:UvrD-helicase domain-containing protein [Planctomycetota bacterium]